MKLGLLNVAAVASANTGSENNFYENGLSQTASNWKKLLDASGIKSTSKDRLNDKLEKILKKLEDRDTKLRLVLDIDDLKIIRTRLSLKHAAKLGHQRVQGHILNPNGS